MSYQNYRECIEACQACVIACETCASACLREEHPKMMSRCIELDRSCADVCALAVREMVRGSDFVEQTCRLCAEICDVCAAECTRHDHDHCQACAETCRRCAEACRIVAVAGIGVLH